MAVLVPPDGHQTPTTDDYQAATQATRWVDLADGPGAIQVREVAPLRMLRAAEQHGVQALVSGDDSDLDMGQADVSSFIEAVVLPNVTAPTACWGGIGPDDADFDLTALTQDDFVRIIAGMTGQDPDQLQEDADDRFPG